VYHDHNQNYIPEPAQKPWGWRDTVYAVAAFASFAAIGLMLGWRG